MMAVIKKLRKKTTAATDKKTTAKTKAKTTKTATKRTRTKISPDELFAMIERKAFELYVDRGYSHGDDLQDWYVAEQAVSKGIKKK